MSGTAKYDYDSDISKIVSIRAAWVSAVKASDIDSLIALGTDDIAVVYGSGKCVCGKDALRVNLVHDLRVFDIEPLDSYEEIAFHGNWAVEFIETDRTLTAIRGGIQVKSHSKMVVLYSRRHDGSWKVARVIQLEG